MGRYSLDILFTLHNPMRLRLLILTGAPRRNLLIVKKTNALPAYNLSKGALNA